jgi:hypothetical protein
MKDGSKCSAVKVSVRRDDSG